MGSTPDLNETLSACDSCDVFNQSHSLCNRLTIDIGVEKSEFERREIKGERDWMNEKGDVYDPYVRLASGSSKSSSLILTPRSYHQLSSISMDYQKEIDAVTCRGHLRNRRSGFAFHFGDQEVPANAFLNVENDDKMPKMLTVAEMMMKFHADNKLTNISRLETLPSDDQACTHSREEVHARRDCRRNENGLTAERFSLIGLRKVTSSEIEEDLHFLHCAWDNSLNLTFLEKAILTWNAKSGRLIAGLILGIILACSFRFLLLLCSIMFEI